MRDTIRRIIDGVEHVRATDLWKYPDNYAPSAGRDIVVPAITYGEYRIIKRKDGKFDVYTGDNLDLVGTEFPTLEAAKKSCDIGMVEEHEPSRAEFEEEEELEEGSSEQESGDDGYKAVGPVNGDCPRKSIFYEGYALRKGSDGKWSISKGGLDIATRGVLARGFGNLTQALYWLFDNTDAPLPEDAANKRSAEVIMPYVPRRFAPVQKQPTKDSAEDLPRLPKPLKRNIQKLLGRISTFTHNPNLEIYDVVKQIEGEFPSVDGKPLKLVRESIDGWKKMNDGMMRKDYTFTVDGYADKFLVSLYADPETYDTTEVNAFFTDSVDEEKPQFIKKTKQGYDVDQLFQSRFGRFYAIIHRPRTGDYLVAAGYHPQTGEWDQGYYDFNSFDEAMKAMKKRYRGDEVLTKIEITDMKGDLEYSGKMIYRDNEYAVIKNTLDGKADTTSVIYILVALKDGEVIDVARNIDAFKKEYNLKIRER